MAGPIGNNPSASMPHTSSQQDIKQQEQKTPGTPPQAQRTETGTPAAVVAADKSSKSRFMHSLQNRDSNPHRTHGRSLSLDEKTRAVRSLSLSHETSPFVISEEQRGWMEKHGIPATLAGQNAHLSKATLTMLQKTVKLEDCPVGSIIICYEPVPTTESHALTMGKQFKAPLLNGVSKKNNTGDYRNVHAVIVSRNPANPTAKVAYEILNPEAKPELEIRVQDEIVHARGGLGADEPERGFFGVFRVQASALQNTNGKVFVPKDEQFGEMVGLIARVWANDDYISYSVPDLSKMGKPQSFMEWTDEAKENAVTYALQAFTSRPEWAKNDLTADNFKKLIGSMCTDLTAKIGQAAAGQMHLHETLEPKRYEDGVTENGTKIMRYPEPTMDEKKAIIMEGIEKYPTGSLLARNATGISPMVLENLLHKDPYYKPFGRIRHDNPTYKEVSPPKAPNLALSALTRQPVDPEVVGMELEREPKLADSLDPEVLAAAFEMASRRQSSRRPIGDDDITIGRKGGGLTSDTETDNPPAGKAPMPFGKQ